MYDDNADVQNPQSTSQLLSQNLSIEVALQQWDARLPALLKLAPWKDDYHPDPSLGEAGPVYEKLSTVTRLRALNVWILKDRAILDCLLRMKHDVRRAEQGPRMLDLAQVHIQHLRDAAAETIHIVWKLSRRAETFSSLGAWWYSSSYVLHASLVLFGCLLLAVQRLQTEGSQHSAQVLADLEAIVEILKKGPEAVKVLSKNSGKLSRIQATLDKIKQTAETLLSIVSGERFTSSTPAEFPHAPSPVSGDDMSTRKGHVRHPDIGSQGPRARETAAFEADLLQQEAALGWQAVPGTNGDIFPILDLNGAAFNLNDFITI